MDREISVNPGSIRTMNRKSKIWLLTFGCLAGLALSEQAGLLEGTYFSRAWAYTSTDVAKQPPAKDLVSTLHVEKPITRWLPFLKFGETVRRRTSQDRSPNGSIYEKVVTTRTRLWVVGFCSTARYDELAGGTSAESGAQISLGLLPGI